MIQASDIIIQFRNVRVDDGALLDVIRGDRDRAAREIAAHLSEPVNGETVQRLAGEVVRSLRDRVRVEVDNEYPAEEWWDALRHREPEIATRFDAANTASVSPDELARLKALPGWDSGPKFAQHPLLVTE